MCAIDVRKKPTICFCEFFFVFDNRDIELDRKRDIFFLQRGRHTKQTTNWLNNTHNTFENCTRDEATLEPSISLSAPPSSSAFALWACFDYDLSVSFVSSFFAQKKTSQTMQTTRYAQNIQLLFVRAHRVRGKTCFPALCAAARTARNHFINKIWFLSVFQAILIISFKSVSCHLTEILFIFISPQNYRHYA